MMLVGGAVNSPDMVGAMENNIKIISFVGRVEGEVEKKRKGAMSLTGA